VPGKPGADPMTSPFLKTSRLYCLVLRDVTLPVPLSFLKVVRAHGFFPFGLLRLFLPCHSWQVLQLKQISASTSFFLRSLEQAVERFWFALLRAPRAFGRFFLLATLSSWAPLSTVSGTRVGLRADAQVTPFQITSNPEFRAGTPQKRFSAFLHWSLLFLPIRDALGYINSP